MAAPTLEDLLARLDEQKARIERLESTSLTPATIMTADESEASDSHHSTMTRRGMLTTAALGTVGLVGAMLVESEGTASAAGVGNFTSATTTPAVTATNTGTGVAILAKARTGSGESASVSSLNTAEGTNIVSNSFGSTSIAPISTR